MSSLLMLTADPVPLCYFFGKQICFFKMLYFLLKSSDSYDAVLIFGSSLRCAGKCMAKLYAAYIAGLWQS